MDQSPVNSSEAKMHSGFTSFRVQGMNESGPPSQTRAMATLFQLWGNRSLHRDAGVWVSAGCDAASLT